MAFERHLSLLRYHPHALNVHMACALEEPGEQALIRQSPDRTIAFICPPSSSLLEVELFGSSFSQNTERMRVSHSGERKACLTLKEVISLNVCANNWNLNSEETAMKNLRTNLVHMQRFPIRTATALPLLTPCAGKEEDEKYGLCTRNAICSLKIETLH